MKRRKIVPGTVRFSGDGVTVEFAPTYYNYLRMCMLATEYYDGKRWLPYTPGLDNLTTKEERIKS